MAYDPYAPEQEQYSVKSFIAESLNPVSLLKYKYMYDPSTYSASKGLWTPFGGVKDFKAGFTATKKAFKKGFWPGMKQAGKEAWAFGPLGKDHRAGWSRPENLRKAAADAQILPSKIEKAEAGIRAAKARISGFENQLRVKARSVSKLDTVLPGRAVREQLKEYHVLKRRAAINIPRDIETIGRHKAAIIKLGDKLTKARWGVFAGKAARFGLTTGRVFSYGMWALTLWDIGKMVGEPIGRYLIENVNRVGDQYMNRFSPEMGGKIALGYLSTGAATERQRAVEAISRSYINGRSAIGQEAQFLHS